jgi:Domain of unknown function (DUF892)
VILLLLVAIWQRSRAKPVPPSDPPCRRSEEQWADELGPDQAVEMLEETLQEERKTDEALTGLAQSAVNREAQQAAE